jgi:prolyl oligopeptidase
MRRKTSSAPSSQDLSNSPLTLYLRAYLRTNRYLLLTTSTGCEPTNKLAYVALDELPRENDAINFASFDLRKDGNQPLPIVKLVDNFDASYDCVANEGSVFTFHSNLGAPRYKYVVVVF